MSNKGNYNKKYHTDERKDWLIDYFKEVALTYDQQDCNKLFTNLKKYAEQISGRDQNDVTITSLRKIYHQVLKEEDVQSLKRKLIPMCHYQIGRAPAKNKNYRQMLELIIDLLFDMKNEKELSNFKNFMESLVAFVKYTGAVKGGRR